MQNPLNQRAEQLEDRDKREKERISTCERAEEWKERKQKAAPEFPHALPSDVLKFIIPSLLSHTQDPLPASIIPALKRSPLFSLKLHCFLSQTKWFLLRCDALLEQPGGRNSSDCCDWSTYNDQEM